MKTKVAALFVSAALIAACDARHDTIPTPAAPSNATPTPPTPAAWEYHVAKDGEDLDALGAKGWELVSVVADRQPLDMAPARGEFRERTVLRYYFKRPKA